MEAAFLVLVQSTSESSQSRDVEDRAVFLEEAEDRELFKQLVEIFRNDRYLKVVGQQAVRSISHTCAECALDSGGDNPLEIDVEGCGF